MVSAIFAATPHKSAAFTSWPWPKYGLFYLDFKGQVGIRRY